MGEKHIRDRKVIEWKWIERDSEIAYSYCLYTLVRKACNCDFSLDVKGRNKKGHKTKGRNTNIKT